MVKFFFVLSMSLAIAGMQAQGNFRNIYFDIDSFRLSSPNIDLIEKSFAETTPGTKISYRILIHDDIKNKAAVNELDHKRSLELYDYFIAEGVSPNSLKEIRTPGREAKGFISDEMKNLFIYDLEVFKTNPAVDFTLAPEMHLPDGPVETFVLDATKGKTIQTKEGLTIYIPAHGLVFKNGLAPAGPVSLRIREYLHPGAMAAAGLSTQLNESPLKTNYVLWIEANAVGQTLRLKKGSTITISCPKPEGDLANAELYLGQDEASAFSLRQPVPPLLSHTENSALILVSTYLKWIACATPAKTAAADLTLKVPANFNLAIRIVIEKERMVSAAYNLPGGKEIGFTHLPAGQKATLFAYGMKDGKVYFYSKVLQTSAGAKEKIQLKESSIREINAFLASLDKE
jgi:hypothetical protein